MQNAFLGDQSSKIILVTCIYTFLRFAIANFFTLNLAKTYIRNAHCNFRCSIR